MFTKTIMAVVILTPLASVAFGADGAKFIIDTPSITPYQQQTSKENPRPLPQLHVGDYFVYGEERYWPSFLLSNKDERVVREEKTENVTVWVITGSWKSGTENTIYIQHGQTRIQD